MDEESVAPRGVAADARLRRRRRLQRRHRRWRSMRLSMRSRDRATRSTLRPRQGLLRSATAGRAGQLMCRARATDDWNFVAAAKSMVAGGEPEAAVLSADGGESWVAGDAACDADADWLRWRSMALAGLWMGGREGVFSRRTRSYLADAEEPCRARREQYLLRCACATRCWSRPTARTRSAFAVHLPDYGAAIGTQDGSCGLCGRLAIIWWAQHCLTALWCSRGWWIRAK